jgi:hypothetical protein
MAEFDNDPRAERAAERAGAQAAAIGGKASSDREAASGGRDEVQRPLAEAGEGEAEGFELAARELIEHASHGDQHAARQAIEEAPPDSDDSHATEGGEADREYSSGREDDR